MNNNLNNDFVLEIIRLCLRDKNVFHTVNQHLKISYINNNKCKSIWRFIQDYENENSKMPKKVVLRMQFSKDQAILDTIDEIYDIEELNLKETLKLFSDFIKQNKFIEMYDKVADLYNAGEKENAYSLFADSAVDISTFNLNSNTFIRLFSGFDERMLNRTSVTSQIDENCKYGIFAIDKKTNGIQKGEFVLICADSGIGKSQFLNWIGYSNAKCGVQVAHFQAEGTTKQCLDRYDACWTNSIYQELKYGDLSDVDLKKIKAYKNVLLKNKGEIFIESYEKFGNKTISDVRKTIISINNDLAKNNKEPLGLILLDYLELFDPDDNHYYRPSEERHRQQKVSKLLKNLAVEFNVPLVSLTQASNIDPELLNNPDFVLTRNNLSEDKGKIRPVDTFFTLNQTSKEYAKKKIRIHNDKLRDNEGKFTVPIITNFKKSRFYDHAATLNMIEDDTDDIDDSDKTESKWSRKKNKEIEVDVSDESMNYVEKVRNRHKTY